MKTKKVKRLRLKQNIKDKLKDELNDTLYAISGIVLLLLFMFIVFLLFYK